MTKLPKLTALTLATLLHDPVDAQERKPAAEWITVATGALPIILSAPHGGRAAIPELAPRRGVGVPQFTIARDSNTAELAEALAAKLTVRLGAQPFLVIARFERKYVDANRAQAAAFESPGAKIYYDAYHRALASAVARLRQIWGTGLLLDIHGQGAERDTIFRGTDNRGSVAALVQSFGREAVTGPKSILGQMTRRGYKVEPGADERERRYTGAHTTRMYGSHREGGVDAIQLEFGANLRAKSNLERTADDLAHAIEIFAKAYLPLAARVVKEIPATRSRPISQ
jgi:N-formylglutamate amidohydrolase